MPLRIIFIILYILFTLPINSTTVILHPLGHAGDAGRVIDGCYERGITLQLAQTLKKELQKIEPSLQTLLTRVPGEQLEEFQCAHFSNRVYPDIFISLQCYQESSNQRHIAIYHHIKDITDNWHKSWPIVEFMPYDQAHLHFINITKNYTDQLYQSLKKSLQDLGFLLNPVIALPCTPLIGIHAPAIVIELGLVQHNDWNLITQQLAQAIVKLVKNKI